MVKPPIVTVSWLIVPATAPDPYDIVVSAPKPTVESAVPP